MTLASWGIARVDVAVVSNAGSAPSTVPKDMVWIGMPSVAVRDHCTGGYWGGARMLAIGHSTYSFNVALPTPDCVDIGAMGVTIGQLCGIDHEGAITDGLP